MAAADPQILSRMRAALRSGGQSQSLVEAVPDDASPAEQARALARYALRLLDRAGADAGGGSPQQLTALLGQARECIRLLGQFSGDLASGAAVTVVFQGDAAKAFAGAVVRHAVDIMGEALGPAVAAAHGAELMRRIEAERQAAVAATQSPAKRAALPG